jgi:hypothetical protein
VTYISCQIRSTTTLIIPITCITPNAHSTPYLLYQPLSILQSSQRHTSDTPPSESKSLSFSCSLWQLVYSVIRFPSATEIGIESQGKKDPNTMPISMIESKRQLISSLCMAERMRRPVLLGLWLYVRVVCLWWPYLTSNCPI